MTAFRKNVVRVASGSGPMSLSLDDERRPVLTIPDPAPPSPPSTVVEHLAAAYALYGNVTAVAYRSAMGVSPPLSADDQYQGGILLPNGHVLGMPVLTDLILNINTNDDTATRDTLGSTLNPAVRNFNGAVFCPELGADGRAYFFPKDGQSILVLDAATMTTVYQGAMGATLNSSWRGGVRAANGKIYCCPASGDCLVIDPSDATASPYGTAFRTSLGVSMSGSDKWGSLTRAENGKLYGVQNNSATVLIIDPADTTASAHGTAFLSAMGAAPGMSDTSKWQGGCLGADGCVYGIPFHATDICKIDTTDLTGSVHGTLTRSAMGAVLNGTSKWQGGCNGPDGRIYAHPRSAKTILRIDPIGQTAVVSTFGADFSYDSSKWQSGNQALNGSIYNVPQDASDILVITFPGVPALDADILLGPYLNVL